MDLVSMKGCSGKAAAAKFDISSIRINEDLMQGVRREALERLDTSLTVLFGGNKMTKKKVLEIKNKITELAEAFGNTTIIEKMESISRW